MIRTTAGSDVSLPRKVASAVVSAVVSGPVFLAARSGTGMKLDVPKGAASFAAFSNGALAGRNLVLSFWVTLDKDGKNATAAAAPTTHASSMYHRNRRLNRPRASKMASTFMAEIVVDGDGSPGPGRPGSRSLQAVPSHYRGSRDCGRPRSITSDQRWLRSCRGRRGGSWGRTADGAQFRDMPTAVLAAGLLAGQTRVLGSYWDSPSVTGSPKGTVRKDSAKGTLMHELRLVAVSEDGSYAVLVVPGRSGRFALPIDERLRTVARGQFSRLAQYEIEVESPLRPKEIQDRIRAGETAEEIADAAGLPVDRIRRFEGPVLAEREFRATEAQRATVRGPGESGLARRLGEIVAERLADIGANAEDAEWDSRKRQDGNWQVQLAYTIAGRMHVAEWVYDPRGKHVTPEDDEAVRLSLDEAYWPAPRQPSAAAVTATVTPISSRTASAASASAGTAGVGSRHSDHRTEPDRG